MKKKLTTAALERFRWRRGQVQVREPTAAEKAWVNPALRQPKNP